MFQNTSLRSVFNIFFTALGIGLLYTTACVPPPPETEQAVEDKEAARLDSLRRIKCPRMLSSAAEYYKNRDWQATVMVYKELVALGCDRGREEDVYQYWAIAYENLGKFDSSEYVLLQGLKYMPDNIALHKRLGYAYKRQGKTDKEIFEYEKIIDLDPQDLESMTHLSDLYGKVGRYDDQIFVLRKILEIEPNNKNARADLANAYEKLGKDPLDIYRQRFADNPDDLSAGLDLADQLLAKENYNEAITVLNRMLKSESGNGSVSKKLVLKKLAKAYYKEDRLEEASDAYEQLFDYDRRDFRTALEIVKINIELSKFAKAMNWANKAIKIAPDNGECLATKGMVYFKAFQECRKDVPTIDDKIVAALAHEYFLKAEQKKYFASQRNREWLEKYELVFGASDWFMLDDEQKIKGSISPSGECYSWITESVKKQPGWK